MIQETQPPSPAAPVPAPWRSTDFANVLDLQDWLKAQRVTVRHSEPQPFEMGIYEHPGYQAVQCAVCGRPTIRAVGNRDPRTCGRRACG